MARNAITNDEGKRRAATRAVLQAMHRQLLARAAAAPMQRRAAAAPAAMPQSQPG
jgi:hypothetical protein